jgi:tRNA(Ile)-lysidine synthase
MVEAFVQFFHHHKIDVSTTRFLVAVSGGIDSVVLTELFRQAHFNYALAHVNFKLRGTESDKDAAFVQSLAEGHGVDCHSHSFETKEYAVRNGISIQMAARELRMQWMEDARREKKFHWVALAHHANDQLETIVFNMAKGTGFSGLRGMKPVNNHLIRPLLDQSRATIETFAAKHQLAWREDRSNQSDDYTRNRIRHHIIPELEKINPSLFKTFSATQERLLAADAMLNESLELVRDRCLEAHEDHFRIYISKLPAFPQQALALLFILEPYGFSYDQVRQMCHSLTHSGKSFLSNHYEVLVDREFLLLAKRKAPSGAVEKEIAIEASTARIKTHAGTISAEIIPRESYEIEKDANVAALDAECISFPLTIRKWKAGDRFVPLGMNHQKKISDFLVDEKVSVHTKRQVEVLCMGEDIIWLMGYRIADPFCIRPETATVMRLKYFPDR